MDKRAAQIEHLERLREEARDEIKRRIEQRDKYSIQLTIALGAVVGVAFSDLRFERVLIVPPLISIYFTVLILYSYRIHAILALYLSSTIEPQLARLCDTKLDWEWENFYTAHAVPGIRRGFFLLALWVVSIASLAYLWTTQCGDSQFMVVLSVAALIYAVALLVITIWDLCLWRRK